MFQLNMDCEGPLTQNDNAFELCQEFIPSGGRFFSIVSKYDDFLADVIQKPGYKAGDTLKLVLPFLKAHGITDEIMERFSERTLVLLPGTEAMLPELNTLLPSFIISTSYRPYIEALCRLTSFPLENCYCTDVCMDAYSLPDEEARLLQDLSSEIAEMEMMEWPPDAKSYEDLGPASKHVILRLDEIFWKIVPSMSIGRMFDEVNPVGGTEKARALKDSTIRTGLGGPERVIYAGDSITDSDALDLVRRAKGLSISFNGNRYALRSAEYAVLSDNTCILYGISALLKEAGKGVLSAAPVNEIGMLDLDILLERLSKLPVKGQIMDQIVNSHQNGLIEVYRMDEADLEYVIKKSERARKEVRGHQAGELG